MPYAPTPSPSLSSTSPVILVSEPLSSFEARRFASPESCLGDSDLCSHAEVLVCSRHGPASRPRGQPGPHVSLGWMCSLFGGREHAGHSRTKPQAQRLVAAPSSLLPGAQGPSAGIGCVRPGRWACVWGAFPPLERWSGSIFKALAFCLSGSECVWCSRINTPALLTPLSPAFTPSPIPASPQSCQGELGS